MKKTDLLYLMETPAEGHTHIESIRYITDHNRESTPRPMPTAVSSHLSVTDLTPL